MKQTVTLDHAFRVLKLIERIDSFKELDKDNWNGYGAEAIHWHSISNAKTACLLASPISLKHMGVFPGPDGSVLFENKDDKTLIWTVECSPSDIKIGAICHADEAEHEITFKSDVNWSRDLDLKVGALFRDAVMDEKGLKAHLFFVPAQWRKWRAAKKWFQRLTGQKVSTGTQIALAFEDGRLIQAQTVDEFIKRFKEVTDE